MSAISLGVNLWSQASDWPEFLAAGQARAAQRKVRLQALGGVRVMDDAEGDAGVWPFFQVLMPTEKARDEALERLWPAGLGVGRLFVHALADYGYLPPMSGAADIANARDYAARLLVVTNSEWLSESRFEHVCSVLERSLA